MNRTYEDKREYMTIYRIGRNGTHRTDRTNMTDMMDRNKTDRQT